MPIYRTQASLQDADGLSKDRYVNTFYIAGATPLNDEGPDLVGWHFAVVAFYTALTGHLAGCVNSTSHTVKSYDMSLPANGRPPLVPVTFALAPTNAGLPNEVALAVTLESTPRPPIAPQSTRGRIYLGPLADSTTTAAVVADRSARPSAAFITDVLAALSTLSDAVQIMNPAWALCVASTVQGKTALAAGSRQAYQVVSISADDAWDTQRSRGNAPTARTRTVKETAPAFALSW